MKQKSIIRETSIHPVRQVQVDRAVALSLREIRKRVGKFGDWSDASRAETVGILTEEYHEVLDALRANDRAAFIKELAQVAGVCIYGIASLLTNKEAHGVEDPLPPEDA